MSKKSNKPKKLKSRNPYALPALARTSAGPIKSKKKDLLGPAKADWETEEEKKEENQDA